MYAKLFKQVITSSLTQDEPIDVRGVFFMLLAVAEKDGEVPGNDEAIARIINVPSDVFTKSVARLMRRDPRSASKEEEGRRLVKLESCPGYRIVNYAKYSGIHSDEKRREYFRNYQRQRRKVAKDHRGQTLVDRTLPDGFPLTEAEAVEHADFVGVTREFAAATWHKANGRGGCDAKDVPIRNWRSHLKTESVYAQASTRSAGVKVQAPVGPSLKEVSALCHEKWPNEERRHVWATSFHRYWAERQWKRDESTIDWKVELSAQVSKWRHRDNGE